MRAAAALVAALSLGACTAIGDFFAGTDEAPLRGDRISVLTLEDALKADPEMADVEIRLPAPYRNPEWAQAGGHPSHAMHHLALADQVATRWSADAGAGATRQRRVTAAPLAAQGLVFTLDANSSLSAFRMDSGARAWVHNLVPRGEEAGAIGGGIAVDGAVLYAGTAYGEVTALRAETGELLWSRRLGVPLRGAPTIAEGRVFVLTQNNQLHALSVETGETLWMHAGFSDAAGLLSGASPAVANGVVLAPYTSGELFALRADNGRVLWSDSLTRSGRLAVLSEVNDIAGLPVVDRGRVFAVGNAGRMVAIDLITGERLWEQDVAGVQTPWVAGEYIYVVTAASEVVALSRSDGGILWVQTLPRFEDERRRRDPISWRGPVLAGDRLLLGSSRGEVVALSPYTGRNLGTFRVSGGVAVTPIVADGSLYVFTDSARLYALR